MATPRRSTFQQLAAGPLRLVTSFGGAALAERLKLRGPAQSLLYHGARSAARAATTVGSYVAPARKLVAPTRLPPESVPQLFDLSPTDEQKLVIESMRRFADEVLRPAAAAADEAAAAPQEILQRSTELGLAMLVVPEALGGAAATRSSVTGALIATELARGDMGLALAILAPLAVVQALVDWGTAAQQERWLPAFLGEKFVPAALALLEPRPLFDPLRLGAGAVRADRGWKLYGEKSLVPLGASAELFLVAVEVKGAGPRLFLVERDAPGLTVTPEPGMGVRAAGTSRVKLDGVLVSGEAMLGGGAIDLGALIDRARVAWGALAVGTAQAALEYVIRYCNERQAFGEPISHRQSVAFTVADMAIELAGMRLLVQRAASLIERDAPVTREAAWVRTQCTQKGMRIGTDGVQLLGGHGFIKEHPLERWYRDLRALGVMEGALLV